jgi:hypothetical protein
MRLLSYHVLTFAVFACGGPRGAEPRAPATADRRVFTVAYREPASVFETMDNVSQWHSGKAEQEYRTYWKERFGIGPEDDQRFAAYKDIRERYYTGESGPPVGPFPPVKAIDRVAQAFYDAPTFDAAYASLATFMAPEDVAALRAFHAAYAKANAELTAESSAYASLAGALQRELEHAKADAFAARVASFYRAPEPPPMTILYVWWPPVASSAGNTRDRVVLIKRSAQSHFPASEDIDLPIHELTHWLSGHQPAEQKAELAAEFTAGCVIGPQGASPGLLEEPLAVVQQKLFLAEAAPARFDFEGSWYGDPWVGVLAKLLYDPVRRAELAGRKIDAPLMHAAAKACTQLRAVSERRW